jgi:hypothetical protein
METNARYTDADADTSPGPPLSAHDVRRNLLYGKHSDHSKLKETVRLLGIEHC